MKSGFFYKLPGKKESATGNKTAATGQPAQRIEIPLDYKFGQETGEPSAQEHDSAPCIVAKNMTEEKANAFARAMAEAGAKGRVL